MKKKNQRLFTIINKRGHMQSKRQQLLLEAQRLLESGVDPNVEWGGTALHAAANSPDAEMVTLLLAHGADISAKNEDGQTALQVAGDGVHLCQAFLGHDDGFREVEEILKAHEALGGST